MDGDAAGESAYRAYRAARSASAARWLVVAAAGVGVVAFAGAGLWWAVLGCATAGLVARPRGDADRWRRGADGERNTALLLDALSRRRWAVMHDRALPGSRSNIDHLVVGPTGVWLVDSKSYRGGLRAGWRSVRVAGRRLDTGPARWEAEVASARLGVAVTPLVAVHGEGLPRRGRRCDGVRVVPASSLLGRVRRGRRVLSRRQVARVAAEADRLFPPACGR